MTTILFDATAVKTRTSVRPFASGLEPLPARKAIVRDAYTDQALIPTPSPRRFNPSPTERAWEAGYALGRDKVPAAPSRELMEAEASAWRAGYEQGRATAEDEDLSHDADWNSRLEDAYADAQWADAPYGYE